MPPSTTRLALSALVAATLASGPVAGAQTLITFDDLPPTADAVLPNNTGGLIWNITGTFGYVTAGVSPYQNVVCRSGSNCAYNGFAASGLIQSSTPITLTGWIRSWAPGFGSTAASVLIETLNASGGLVSSQRLVLTSSYQQFTLSSLFSTVRLTPNTNAAGTGSASGFYLMDDLTVNPVVNQNVVPEPSTYALMATGMLGLIALRRSRARRA
jgi:hypothetical protein